MFNADWWGGTNVKFEIDSSLLPSQSGLDRVLIFDKS